VKKVGSGVTRVVEGDQVLLSFNSCGKCQSCQSGAPAYCKHCLALNFGGTRLDGTHTASMDGKPIYANFFGQSSLSRHSVVNERSVLFLSSAELISGCQSPSEPTFKDLCSSWMWSTNWCRYSNKRSQGQARRVNRNCRRRRRRPRRPHGRQDLPSKNYHRN
jgi:Alcohol dehydrogenase GroES-like domain